jgi:hypothetical protein
MLREALKNIPGYVSCPYKDKEQPGKQCRGGCIYEDGEGAILFCGMCNRPFCGRHKVIWHEDMTCKDYDNRLNADYRSSLDIEREREEQYRKQLANWMRN